MGIYRFFRLGMLALYLLILPIRNPILCLLIVLFYTNSFFILITSFIIISPVILYTSIILMVHNLFILFMLILRLYRILILIIFSLKMMTVLRKILVLYLFSDFVTCIRMFTWLKLMLYTSIHYIRFAFLVIPGPVHRIIVRSL